MSLDKENHNYDDPKKVSGLTAANDVSVGGFLNLNGLATTRRPSNPLLGATYFDSNLNQVFIYTPTGWRGMFLGSAPAAPTIGTVTTSGLSASVPFSAPADNGGSAITSYIVTSSPGGVQTTGTSSPIVVSGLALNTAYTFTVAGVNVFGVGTSSATSNQVFPIPPTVTGGALTSDSTYYYRTFTSSGTLGIANSPLVADVLVVGGGGGGGISGDRSSGGGGAGGVTYSPGQTFNSNQTVTVGSGGPAGGSGFPSSLGSISAAAGGQGGGSGSYTILSTTNVGNSITLTLNTNHNLKVGNQITPLGIAAANSATYTVSAVAASTPSVGFAQYTTTAAHGFQVGWLVFVGGASVAGYNVSGAIITSIPSATTFVVKNFTVGAATFSGGTVVANYAGNTVSNAVIFETAQISAITNSSNVVTVALTVNHGFNLGDTVQIAGTSATTNAPNGNWIISNVVNSTTFQVVVAAAPTGTIVTTSASIQSPSYNYAGRIPFAITAVPAANQVTYTATATPTGAFTNPSGSMGISGGNGGSGGGGNHNGQGNQPGTGITGQGFKGGGGYDSAIGVFGAGGGGGAGGTGAPGTALGGGDGGGGTSAFVSWLPITALGFNGYIAGGGGGAGQTLTAYMSGLVGVTLTNVGTTVTGTTAAAHGLTAGQTIRISFAGATTNAPNGNWIVATTPTTTTFTFSVSAAPTGTITGAELGTPTASFTFSGNTVTCTTPAPHGMIAGQRVSVYATTATTNPPNGDWTVASIISGTQFTFNVFSAPSGTISNGIVVCPGEGVVAGVGGIGGGGNGGVSFPVNGSGSFSIGQNGVPNTGGGGGGAAGINSPSSALGVSYSGSGGSGLVVVRYARTQIGG